MPLVTITCDRNWFPPDEKIQRRHPPLEWITTINLANTLPELIVCNADRLHLDHGTPESAVQVDIRSFHHYAVNTPNLWVHVWLTEALTEEERLQVRETLIEILEKWFSDQAKSPETCAIDVFFGPGHGYIATKDSILTPQKW